MNEITGYHINKIDKGTLGKFSKIREEFQELEDAYKQNDDILMICECSDLIGAIKHFIEDNYNISLDSLLMFNKKTEAAFMSGKRQ